jgi:phosphoserine phosphatase
VRVRVAIAFDFDDTLGPDSTSGYLASMGVDVPDFWKSRVEQRIQSGWDPVLAYLQEMIAESQSREPGRRFTRDSFAEWGRSLPLYPGVTAMFRELRTAATDADPQSQVEFFLISSGLLPILDHTKVRDEFTDAWACDFAFDDAGAILTAKNVVSFTDKTRYLFQIHKGIVGPDARKDPFQVNKKFRPEQMYVPMEQMIFVGDGFTDVPCFSLLQKNHGFAIGVFDQKDRDKWGRAWGFIETGRVNNLVPANYAKNGPIRAILKVAISGIVSAAVAREKTYRG